MDISLVERLLSDAVRVDLSSPAQDSSVRSYIIADIMIRQASAGQGAGVVPPSTFIERIELRLSFTDTQTTKSPRFDAFQTIIDAPLFGRLRFQTEVPDGPEYETFKAVLGSVLQGAQLDRTLRSHKLEFQFLNLIATSEAVLSVPATHTVDGVAIVLNAAERAEWMLHITQDKRQGYLQELIAARESSGTVSGPPVAVAEQDAAVEQAQGSVEAGVQAGDEAGVGTDG